MGLMDLLNIKPLAVPGVFTNPQIQTQTQAAPSLVPPPPAAITPASLIAPSLQLPTLPKVPTFNPTITPKHDPSFEMLLSLLQHHVRNGRGGPGGGTMVGSSGGVSPTGSVKGYGKRVPNVIHGFDLGAWTSTHTNGQIPTAQLAPLHTDPGFYLQANAAVAWDHMNTAYAQQTGHRFSLTGSYRDLATQQRLYAEHLNGSHPAPVAVPGTSNHGWGLAVDINTGDLSSSALAWLHKNAARYGFTGISSENWHWEFGQHSVAPSPRATPKPAARTPHPVSRETKARRRRQL